MLGEVLENYTILDHRTIGFVLHSEKIEVSAEPYKFTKDWALIELYKDKIDWTTFKGNKLWVGTSFSTSLSPSPLTIPFISSAGGKLSGVEYRNMMFPGLESFTRVHEDNRDGVSREPLEIAVLPYDHTHGRFSGAGDSG
ncbi:hypothetical protein H0H81_002043 [Sphagnurus paluster]|uniref:Uncharacterized protein n=1 Tax=Sphagnurus paluster TaxID=117069 RepID=A0A9P7FQM3_9AGAR|nr:hypothetical protein H0H81_002043 [Sphagnurus paluster]